jgi:carbamoyl-phosphate synthase large subunit
MSMPANIYEKVPVTVLISSIGRRTQLAECFQAAFRKLDLEGRVIGVDSHPAYAPASYLVESYFEAPPCGDNGYIDHILSICSEQKVSLVIPTIDPELPLYSAARGKFAAIGAHVAVSGPETVGISGDKERTHQWLTQAGFTTVRQASAAEALARPDEWTMPVIVKPRNGSASTGVMKVCSHTLLKAIVQHDPNLLVQEYAKGEEYTINVFVDDQRRCICAVPHRRIEVRGGEVSKGVTCKNPILMQMAKDLVEKLPDAFGPMNIQCFLSESGEAQTIEINARFGGGFPLADKAGAVFPLWLLQYILGLPSTARFDAWTDRLMMLRYDSAIFRQAP